LNLADFGKEYFVVAHLKAFEEGSQLIDFSSKVGYFTSSKFK